MRIAWALVLLACAGAAMGLERPAGPTVNHYAVEFQWGSPWGGELEAILGGKVRLDASSSQPKGFTSKLYDGNTGNLESPTASFLIFDGPRAVVRIAVPEWREVGSIAVYVLEATRSSKGALSVSFARQGSPGTRLKFARRVIASKAGLAHVEYRSLPGAALSGGEFVVTYENADFSSAFVGEVALDGLASNAPWADPATRGSRLLYWRHWDVPAQRGTARLHALMIKTDSSGSRARDVTPAWLAHPVVGDGSPLPLVVLFQDPKTVDGALELLGLAGRPEMSLAGRLVEAGCAVLVVDVPAPSASEAPAAHAARIDAVLLQVLEGAFAKHGRIAIDRQRMSIWGYGTGTSTVLLAAVPGRYRRVAISRPASAPNPSEASRVKVIGRPGASGDITAEEARAIAEYLAGSTTPR
ncbi:MAG TPA: hypothetical protein VM051_00245 [Usitatibacter sp.]|nr:hypothetical protein [Usitatibacter sp.]